MIRYVLGFPKKYTISIVVLLIVASFFVFKDDKEEYEYVVVERGDLEQVVSVTGKVKPSSKVDLAFESGGRVAGLHKEVGDHVYIGQKLASLNSAQYQAQYLQAKANLEVEESKLSELIKGVREEEIVVQKIKVQNAEKSLIDAENNLLVKIKDSFTKSDDAVRNKTDQILDSPRSADPQIIFDTSFILESSIEAGRVVVEDLFNTWSDSLSVNQDILNDISDYTNAAKQNLNTINTFLENVSLAVNALSVSSTLSQATIDGYKTDIATARTNVNTALSNLSAAEEKYRTAESNLLLEQQQLILKKAGSTHEEIKAQESKVKSAEANVKNYEALIAKTIIYSPISGIITKKEVEVGEIVQSNTHILTIISDNQFEIEAFIPEADIAKIKINDNAMITLDAYDEIDFEAKIIFIDPAETVIEGVSTYKTKLQFMQRDDLIRSGMTANIDILTASREDIIYVPYRVIRSNGGNFVKILGDDNEMIKKDIKTGMRSTDGRVEIISGIKEGDKVITD